MKVSYCYHALIHGIYVIHGTFSNDANDVDDVYIGNK